jgi:hypothetical protein
LRSAKLADTITGLKTDTLAPDVVMMECLGLVKIVRIMVALSRKSITGYFLVRTLNFGDGLTEVCVRRSNNVCVDKAS